MSTAKRKQSGYKKVECRIQSYYHINFISGLYSKICSHGNIKKFIYDMSWGISNRNKFDELYQPIILRGPSDYKIYSDGLQIIIPISSINVDISSAIMILSNALNWFLPNLVSNVSCVNTNIEISINYARKQIKQHIARLQHLRNIAN